MWDINLVVEGALFIVSALAKLSWPFCRIWNTGNWGAANEITR
jgi:hypothetical protein